MSEKAIIERRDFLKKAAAFGAAVTFSSPLLKATGIAQARTKEGDDFTFLFQGDSITDGNRTRNNDWNHVMGHGYQYIIASKLWYDFPKKGFHFFNRGISGNKITDLAARWQKDTLEIKPNVLSILVGINDTAAFLNGNKDFAAENFESSYRSLLQQSMDQLPDVQLILCEPFILPVGKVKNRWDDYSGEIKKRQQSVLKLSREFNAVFIPFQAAFNKALSKAPAEYWIWDGVHPMPAGHELMAREWLHHVRKKLRFIK
jgi:lysophospholipase L1-like esterase